MKVKLFAALAAVVMTAAPAHATEATSRDAALANNDFGFHLFKNVTKRTEKGNKFLSPISAYLALSVLYNGAQGQSEQEIHKVLFSRHQRMPFNMSNNELMNRLTSNRDVTLHVANSLWARDGYTLRPEFERTATQAYRATARTLDFAAPSASGVINGWVKENTGGKIEKIVPDTLPSDAALYIINATYFDAEWQSKFKSGETAMRSFLVGGGLRSTPIRVNVPTMYKEGRFKTVTYRAANVIELPYKGGSTSMIIVVPTGGLTPERFAGSLNAERWNALTTQLDRAEEERVLLTLPKIKLDYEETLNETLKTMGMPSVFSAATARLEGISTDPRKLFVSNVKQKTHLQVDEEGTKAAAATAIEARVESAIVGKSFNVDRPYFFAIREKSTNAILFLGTIAQPEGGQMPPASN